MRGSRLFLVGIILLLVFMFIVQYNMPKKFAWTPTFSQKDKQPFGCLIFDDVVSASLPTGQYTVGSQTLYQLSVGDTSTRKAILVVADKLGQKMSDTDLDALLTMAGRGDKIMLVSTNFPAKLQDALEVKCSFSYFSALRFKRQATRLFASDSIFWVGDSAVYSRRIFRFFPEFCQSAFEKYNPRSIRILSEMKLQKSLPAYELKDSIDTAYYQKCHPLTALAYPRGKGEIFLVSTPLLFTNYGMLNHDHSVYLFRLLSQLKGLPLIRTEAYLEKENTGEQMSPFRYFLSHRPLRWALYLSLAAVLLFMLFTARRRQRVIPVVSNPKNKSLEFTEQIGTLYYQKKDHDDLVQKKFNYFAEEMRRHIQVDVADRSDDEHLFTRIAHKTGLEEEEIKHFFDELRPVLAGCAYISDEQMKKLINKMNELINHL